MFRVSKQDHLREFDTRVYERVEDIAEKAANHRHQAAEEDDAHDHVIVAVHHGVVIKQAHAVDIEDLFNEERTRKHQGADFGKACGDRDEGVTERVANERLVKAHALRKSRTHVVLAEFLQRGILHEEREEREFANHVSENRQNQMVP